MTVKEFFKSNVFKCITALLCVLLSSGAFLTVCFGFMEVTEGERLNRAVASIYGGKEAYKVVFTDGGKEVLNYLVSSTGKRGYAGGNVTCWVAITVENGVISGIYKVVISQSASQTLMSDINGSSILQDIADGYESGIQYVPDKDNDEYIVAGATMSSTAVCNSVNGALSYVGDLLGGNG